MIPGSFSPVQLHPTTDSVGVPPLSNVCMCFICTGTGYLPLNYLDISLHVIYDLQVRDFERVHSRDKHNQQSKKKAGEAAMKVFFFSLMTNGTFSSLFIFSRFSSLNI